MGHQQTVATTIVERSRVVILSLLLITAVLGAGIADLGMGEGTLGADTDEMEAYTYVQSSFGDTDDTGTALVVHDENVLAKESLLEQLRTQEALVTNETVAGTIRTNDSVLGIANVIASATILEERRQTTGVTGVEEDDSADGPETLGIRTERIGETHEEVLPPLTVQRDRLASMSQSEITDTLASLLAEEGTASVVEPFLPSEFDSSDPVAATTLIAITHDDTSTEDDRLAAHAAVVAIAEGELSNTPTVYSNERSDYETAQSTGDSLLLLGPLVLLLILTSLAVAYRDLLDIALGLVGIVVVLLWTAGIMGWAGIEFHFLFVAIPLLLVGLAIDFSIHLVMRYREAIASGGASTETPPNGGRIRVQRAMGVGLAGVLGAFLWVTVTTSTGFLSNLVSSVPEIRTFGVVLAIGIVSTCVVFSTLIPALKTELDAFLAAHGRPRETRAFGAGGPVRRVLESVASLAIAAPWAVVVLVILLSLGGAYGATHVDTDSDRTMFAPEEPPAWMDHLPEPFAPGEYTQREAMLVLDEQFAREGTEGWILMRGDVTDPTTLSAVQRGHDRALERERVHAVESPLSMMDRLAAENETFNRTFSAADTTGDGVPDRNLADVYDEFAALDPAGAENVLNRTADGEYAAVRLIVTVEPGASDPTIDEETRALASAVETGEHSVTPTGRPVAATTAQTDSRDAAIQGVTITVVVVFALLTVGYRRLHGTWSLGSVTLFPMVLLLSWVFGTMALLDVPLNALTAVIASFTVALGVDYCIHMSERFYEELRRTGEITAAVRKSVVGTGGALAGSALTTATGFGCLVVAINPALEQFGFVMGMTIVYAFLASVLVLPSLLVLWAQHVKNR